MIYLTDNILEDALARQADAADQNKTKPSELFRRNREALKAKLPKWSKTDDDYCLRFTHSMSKQANQETIVQNE